MYLWKTIRDFDNYGFKKMRLLYMVPNINNEGGVARTLAIKRTYLSRSGIMSTYSHAK
jgi:hypothetical protein